MALKIIYKKISELKPYENNPRMNEKAVDKVAESIKNFGFKVPMVIDKDNVIVAGHTRYKACEKLGIKEVPCIIADDLTDKQIKAFRLADNKVSDYSIWDNKKLLTELEDIGFDIFTGFEKSDFFNDVKNTAEIEELDESDNSVLEDNEAGVEYRISFRTQDAKLAGKIRDLIESRVDDAQ